MKFNTRENKAFYSMHGKQLNNLSRPHLMNTVKVLGAEEQTVSHKPSVWCVMLCQGEQCSEWSAVVQKQCPVWKLIVSATTATLNSWNACEFVHSQKFLKIAVMKTNFTTWFASMAFSSSTGLKSEPTVIMGKIALSHQRNYKFGWFFHKWQISSSLTN